LRPFIDIGVLVLCFLGGQTFAEEVAIEPSSFSVSGFGTLGYAYDSNKSLGFIRDSSQNGGRPWLIDSRLGLQLAFRVNSQLELISQLVARDQVNNSPAKSIDWAFVSYRPNPNWQLRVGRLGVDAYLQSDTRNVGYASPWVRPPVDFYAQIPIYSFDGVDATYAVNHNGINVQTKLQWGKIKTSVLINGSVYDLRADDHSSFSLSTEAGPWRTRFGYSQFKFANENPFEPLFSALDSVAANAALFFPAISADARSLRRSLFLKGIIARRFAAGMVYDDSTWLIQGEVSQTWCGCELPVAKALSGYVFIGRRFQNLMPYAILSSAHAQTQSSSADWSVLGPAAIQLQMAALQLANAGRVGQRTLSMGARWDVNNQTSLKAQLDHSMIDADGTTLWLTPPTPITAKQHANIFSVVVDFVF
jgi:hypothetical protein